MKKDFIPYEQALALKGLGKINLREESRVYGIDVSKIYDGLELSQIEDGTLTDEQWMEISEKHGLVWSLNEYARQHNHDQIENASSVFIRIIII